MRHSRQPLKKTAFTESQNAPRLIKSPLPFPDMTGEAKNSLATSKFPRRSARNKKFRLWLIGIPLVFIVVVMLFEQASGQGGATLADALRATLGPASAAQVESWYLGLNDTIHQLQYRLPGQHVAAPWLVKGATPTPTLTTSTIPNPTPTAITLAPIPFTAIHPLLSPPIEGEGVWQTQVQSTATATIPSLPIIARTFLRPDPVRPYAVVTMLQFDTRFMRLHMVAGTTQPGGPRGIAGPGIIPVADQQTLLAAFNGGFKFADGQYGMMAMGVTYVPPQPNAATIAVTKEGQILLGAWGSDPRLTTQNSDLLAWRQNAALLINNGVVNPLTSDGAAWGGTILNSTYTWRSGIGITADGSLIYAAGNSLSAQTLGVALQSAGAVMAMQTDINPFWVRAFLYTHNQQHQLIATKLDPSMQGTGNEYLLSTTRDFFYLTYMTPTLPPQNTKRG